jgi:signal transduction histidine kinase
VAAVIVDRGVAAMDADTCTLYLLDEAGARLELLGVEGVPELLVDRLRALDGQSHPATWAAFEAGETVWIETPAAYAARFDGLLPGASRTQAFWSAPLVVEGRRVGLLAMGYHRARRFAPSQRAFVATFTQQCAQALLRALRLDREVAARAAADEASRLKDEFLATVSHELRTPLNALVGWSQMLSSGRLVEEGARARACETIERNALSMTRLVEQLLDVSHAVSGKLRLSLVPVDLAALVEAAVDALRPAAAAKELAVHVSLEPSIEGLVGDPDRLQQVAWNLLCNAVRFTPPQGAVDVSLRRRGDVAELRVRDHGIGFDPSFAPHLFERFRQADGGTTRTHGGLGLGLAIVRQLVELHGGTVEAESEGLGRGAAFTVRLPIVAARAGVEEAPPSGSGVSSRFADPDERPTRAS